MGRRSDNRPRSDSFSSATGSGRSGAGDHFACEFRGTRSRKALPAAMRSSTEGPSWLSRALEMLMTAWRAVPVFAASRVFMGTGILYQKIRRGKSGDCGWPEHWGQKGQKIVD